MPQPEFNENPGEVIDITKPEFHNAFKKTEDLNEARFEKDERKMINSNKLPNKNDAQQTDHQDTAHPQNYPGNDIKFCVKLK